MRDILKYVILDKGEVKISVSTLLTIITVLIITVIVLFIVRKNLLRIVK